MGAGQGEPAGRLIVDALNVIGSRPDGWWRDRAAAVEAFVGRVRAYAENAGRAVTVAVDGRAQEGLPEGEHGPVEVVYGHRRGPGAADDRIVELVAQRVPVDDPLPVTVVTADRDLQERVRALGGEVASPSAFLRDLDAAERA